MLLALTRDVSPAMARCELTHREREPIDEIAHDGVSVFLGEERLEQPNPKLG